MKIFVPMKPPTSTHQEKQVVFRGGCTRFYEPANLKDARAKLTANLAHYAPEMPYVGCLRVMTKWVFPITGKRQDGQWKHTKPDTHNLNKLLFDVMTTLQFWGDDAQVCSEIIEKFWGEKPGIFIQIENL